MSAGLGLYALKPWYAERLAGARELLIRCRVSPNAVSLAGIVAGGLAGAALVALPHGLLAGLIVGAALALRLACANLDGGLARATGQTTTRGAILNEVGDRAAELATFAGLWFAAPHTTVLVAALAASATSWVALAGSAAGLDRIQGGPVGKTERAALIVGGAITGLWFAVLWILALGSAITAVLRLRRLLQTREAGR